MATWNLKARQRRQNFRMVKDIENLNRVSRTEVRDRRIETEDNQSFSLVWMRDS